MRHSRLWWVLLFLVFVFPYVPLTLAGFAWLYERHYLWWWVGLTGSLTMVAWGLARWVRSKMQARFFSRAAEGTTPDPRWSPAGRAAWTQIETIAARRTLVDLPLDRPEVLWDLLHEVLETVARHFRPEAKDPSLEIPVPDVLRTAELVCRDLRTAFAENVPGAHILTLGDLRKFRHLALWGREAYSAYRIVLRVVRLGLNPFAAALSEIRDAAADDLYNASTDQVKQWSLSFCVRKAGFYAIQLYSGQLIDDDLLSTHRTPQTRKDAEAVETTGRQIAEEPLRILVLGQVKAGKSSLINALFGQTRAAVDVVPRTKRIDPYMVEREGIERAIVLDTAGYEEAAGDENPLAPFREAVLHADAVLLVVSARSASRAADRRLLDELRGLFQQMPDRVPPPLVVTLTHIDQLRPLADWDPPYNLTDPVRPKARQIAEAMAAVSDDLALPEHQMVVPVCLRPDRLYNVEEGLAPAIFNVMSEAQRVKYLRCLRSYHDEDYWRHLWRQTVNSGRILLRAGQQWLERRGEE